MGPLAWNASRTAWRDSSPKGRAEGARLATGGGRPAHLERGTSSSPPCSANVDNGSTIAREEIFGPVLSVIPADSEEQAIAIANDTIYGLKRFLFTNDPGARVCGRAAHRGRDRRATMPSRTDFSISFGGFKQSGIGREGGTEGMYPYLEAKTISSTRRRRRRPDGHAFGPSFDRTITGGRIGARCRPAC